MSTEPDTIPEPSPAPAPEQPAEGAPGAQPTVGVELDDSHTTRTYANFARVQGTPEEVIIELGLNKTPLQATPTGPLVIDQTVILSYFTAKRLLAALQMTVQRHEATFGILETNIQKRVQPTLRGSWPDQIRR